LSSIPQFGNSEAAFAGYCCCICDSLRSMFPQKQKSILVASLSNNLNTIRF
jgi:hypothetical protein